MWTAILAVVAKPLTSLLMHVDPAVRKMAFELGMAKRNVKLEDASKNLALSSLDLYEVLAKLVTKSSFKSLLDKELDAVDKSKFI